VVRVLVWHQSNLVSQALATVLANEDGSDVIAASGDFDSVIALATQEQPRVVVLDHASTSTVSIADACRELTRVLPGVRVLVLLDPPAGQRVGADLVKLAPAVGLMDTGSSSDELVRAIDELSQGKPVIDVNLAVAAIKADRNPLTEREREVLRLALQGAPVPDIANRLCLSIGTVRNYLSRITTKTGARTRIEAIRNAERAGWI
jgi:two-component system, NarL family, response regulator DesR